MGNEAASGRVESNLFLEYQDNSNSETVLSNGAQCLEDVDMCQGQHEYLQTYPVMLFESSAEFADEPATTNSDRLI